MKKVLSLVVTACAMVAFASGVFAADAMKPADESAMPKMEKKMEKKKPMKKGKMSKKPAMAMKAEGEMKKEMKDPAPAMK